MLEKIKQIFIKEKSPKILRLGQAEKQIDELYASLISKPDVMRFEVGEDFVTFGEDIVSQLGKFRENKKEETGFILPAVRVIDNTDLQENELVVKIQGKSVYQEFVVPNKESIIEAVDLKLEQSFQEHLEDIFTMESVERLINLVAKKNSYLISNIINILPIQGIKLILCKIIKAGKSIKDITYIFEKISEVAICDGDNYVYNPQKVANEVIEII